MNGVAIIPTIGESPYLADLLHLLAADHVRSIVVDNREEGYSQRVLDMILDVACAADDHLPVRYLWRPGQGIYRTWNLGLRYAATQGVPCLVLNDDIVLPERAAATMCQALVDRPHFGLLGFDYRPPPGDPGIHQVSGLITAQVVTGTFRSGGLGGFAFGANPRACARVDERFRWWGGDDDLVNATMRRGAQVGILSGCPVWHPQPSLTANAHGDRLPDGWAKHDRDLLIEKWGEAW